MNGRVGAPSANEQEHSNPRDRERQRKIDRDRVAIDQLALASRW
jgi:hypothetical protein